MFFSIDRTKQNNFVDYFQFNKFFVSVDSGWNIFENSNLITVYKGYVDYHHISDILDIIFEEKTPSYTGNYCVIIYDKIKNTVSIKSDLYRSFPIYIDAGNKITNLIKLDQTAWADSLITIDENFNITKNKIDVIGEIDTNPIQFEEGINKISSILDKKAKGLVDGQSSLPMAFRKPIHAFLSGGVDSLLVFSFLQKYTKNYELIKYEHIDYTDFWLMNSNNIRKNWAYKQIHHWRKPCILTSGTPGDEFMLRSPVTTNILLQHHGTDLLQMNTDSSDLHYSYFSLPKHKKVVDELAKDTKINKKLSKRYLFWKLCNIIVNDCQHWHIENTLTWTPLRDLEIFKIILRMPFDCQLRQIYDSHVTKRLISNINPEFLNLLSHQKNTGPVMGNLVNFYRQHS